MGPSALKFVFFRADYKYEIKVSKTKPSLYVRLASGSARVD
jgi:hypothetical protein